jgi:hypothetical protein
MFWFVIGSDSDFDSCFDYQVPRLPVHYLFIFSELNSKSTRQDRQDQACLHHPEEGLTPTFLCRIGVKQGCPLSPLLFGLFIDGLEKRLNAFGG